MATAPPQPGLAGSLDTALRDPSFYPHHPARVEVVETHISTVYLAGEMVLKVKKPVVLPFLDYGTLGRRCHMCEEEVRLNRRLAPDLYLGVRALVPGLGPAGWALGGGPADPNAREYAVEMRRFDEHRTLARLAEDDRVRGEDVMTLGRLIAQFHREADPVPEGDRWPERLAREVDENFETLAALEHAQVTRTDRLAGQRFARAFLAAWREHLQARANAGKVREGHGDLRAEHVIFGDAGIEVFDCVEFDPDLRAVDVGADLAFLVMDLAAARRDDLSRWLIEAYRGEGEDPGPDRLLAFYAAYRAWVRAKVSAVRAGELEPASPGFEAEQADTARLAALARRLAWRARGPLLNVVCGGAASGKTFLAEHLAPRAGATVLDSDRVRKRRLGIDPGEPAPASAYTPAGNALTYRELGWRAGEQLDAGESVVVAATFRHRSDREAFAEGLGNQPAPRLFIQCVAPAGVLADRAASRTTQPNQASDAPSELAARQALEFEPLDEVTADEHLVLRTDRPVAELMDEVEARLDARLAAEQVP